MPQRYRLCEYSILFGLGFNKCMNIVFIQQIRVTHAQRTYRFGKIMPEGAANLKFDLNLDPRDPSKGSKKVTVQQYLEDHYKPLKLRYPSLNCLHVGNPEKNVYIPMEVSIFEIFIIKK